MSAVLALAFLFFLGCIYGWIIEVIFRRFFSKNNPARKWINPGFLTGPWLPIYGIGLCLMSTVSTFLYNLNPTASGWVNTLIILIAMAIVMTILELIAGLIFNTFFNVKLWDYSKERFNFKGVICLKFSLAWGILGCLYYFVINPFMIQKLLWLSEHLTFSFFIGAFFGVFTVDLVNSLGIMAKIHSFAEERKIVVAFEGLKENIAEKRAENKEKSHFLFNLRTSGSINDSLQDYTEKQAEE